MSCAYLAEYFAPQDYERYSESSDGTGNAKAICPHLLLLRLSTVDSQPSLRPLVAATADVYVKDNVDAFAKNADLGCSATTINCSITYSM
ncbi:unnamed protein product [Taenia asiatica]|uniref:Uncharacterized protein n=1 Tax=Taenia asiatica TaxID=60517 RepID=A0A0R3WGF5_TAEAS|nr:unnamed protein product [Taenia asiatica]